MQKFNLKGASEMVSLAGYDAENKVLYLTYHSGKTTIAYHGVDHAIYEELKASAYPDVCVRFKVQAHHPFRRVEAAPFDA